MENKIIIITRKTRLNELMYRFNTFEQAKFYIEHMGADFQDYIEEDRQYNDSLNSLKESLKHMGKLQIVDKEFLPNFIFSENDIVVILGPDGLVVNTSKYLNGQPVIAINPDIQRWDGILLPFTVKDAKKIIMDVMANKHNIKFVTMAMANLNDGQSLYAVNDLFIGQKSHVSARYEIKLGDCTEKHSSSGIIISTGLGSTGWFKSIIRGAEVITGSLANEQFEFSNSVQTPWHADYLYFSVREPFPSIVNGTSLVFGKIDAQAPLVLTSLMPANGVIFSDGIEADFLSFNAGAIATINIADKKVNIVV
jgi:NAD kinase